MNARKRKIFDENRSFNKMWTERFGFIEVNGKPQCLICNLKLQNNKSSNIERHFDGKHSDFSEKYPDGDSRKKAIHELQNKTLLQRGCFSNWIKSSSTSTEASFELSLEIAKAGKPFTDGEFIKNCMYKISDNLFKDFKNHDEILKKIQDLPLSARTVKERIINISAEVSDMQLSDINSAEFISLAVDESTDVTDVSQCCVMAKYITFSGVQEELLELLPLKGHTTGEEISESIVKCLKSKNINIDRIASIATDGAPAMIAKNKGFVKLFSNYISHEIISFHCILHQEALVAKSLGIIPNLKKVMDVVIPIINFITARALNHRLFTALLEEINTKYKDLLTFTAVRWLSRGKVLNRFSECLQEVIIFLESKNYNEEHLKLLVNHEWLENFYFLLDMTEHFNKLNLKLQGKGNTALQLLEEVLTFVQKLELFKVDISNDEFVYFDSVRNYRLNLTEEKTDCKIFADIITTISNSFASRFQDFKKYQETLKFILQPLQCNLKLIDIKAFPGISITELQLELLEILNKSIWVEKLQHMVTQIETYQPTMEDTPQNIIFRCWNTFPNNYSNTRRLALGLLTLFGSTYSCEQFFSSMNYIKNKYRSRLTDESLKALLRLKTTQYVPNLKKLAGMTQVQKSH